METRDQATPTLSSRVKTKRSRGVTLLQLLILFCAFQLTPADFEEAKGCQDIMCENNNVCVSIANGTTSPAHCQCRGKWAGLRCEQVLEVKLHTVTAETAVLRISGDKDQFSDLHIQELTLATWGSRVNSSQNCVMSQKSVTEDKSGLLSLQGLEKDHDYVFCVVNGHFDLCAFFRLGVADAMLETNCLQITTKAVDDPPFDVFVIIVPVVAAVVVLLVVLFLYIHRQSLVFKMVLNYCCCRSCYCCRKRLLRHKRTMHNSAPHENSEAIMPPDIDADFFRDPTGSSNTLLSEWRSRVGLMEQPGQSCDFIDDYPVETADRDFLSEGVYQRLPSSQSHIGNLYQLKPFGNSHSDHFLIQDNNVKSGRPRSEIFTTSKFDTANRPKSTHHSSSVLNALNNEQSTNLPDSRRSPTLDNHYIQWPMYQYQLTYPYSSDNEVSGNVNSKHDETIYAEPTRRLKQNGQPKTISRPLSAVDFHQINSRRQFQNQEGNLGVTRKVPRPVSMGPTTSYLASNDVYIDSTFGLSPYRAQRSIDSQKDYSHSDAYIVCTDPKLRSPRHTSGENDITMPETCDRTYAFNTLPRFKRGSSITESQINEDEVTNVFFSHGNLIGSKQKQNDEASTTDPDDVSVQGSDQTSSTRSDESQTTKDTKSAKPRVPKLIRRFERAGRIKTMLNAHNNKEATTAEQEFRDFMSPISEDRRKAQKRSFFHLRPKSAPPVRIPSSISEHELPAEDMFQGHPSQHAIPPLYTDDEESTTKPEGDNNEKNGDDVNDVSEATTMSTLPISDMISSFEEVFEDTRNLVTPFCTGDSTSDDAEEFDDEEASCLGASSKTLQDNKS